MEDKKLRNESDGRGFVYATFAICFVFVCVGGWMILQRKQAHGQWLLGRDCPLGTDAVGARPPKGTELWCMKRLAGGARANHGRYMQWYPSGRERTQGWYTEGVMDGHWTTFAEDGSVIAKGAYRGGDRNGTWLLAEDGDAIEASVVKGQMIRYTRKGSGGQIEYGRRVGPDVHQVLIVDAEGRAKEVGRRHAGVRMAGTFVSCDKARDAGGPVDAGRTATRVDTTLAASLCKAADPVATLRGLAPLED